MPIPEYINSVSGSSIFKLEVEGGHLYTIVGQNINMVFVPSHAGIEQFVSTVMETLDSIKRRLSALEARSGSESIEAIQEQVDTLEKNFYLHEHPVSNVGQLTTPNTVYLSS